MKKLSIGIVGGSIAGCSAAILLRRGGHEVRVYERSTSRLVGRGGGIGTSGAVFESLIEQDVLDADFAHLTGDAMPFIIRTPEHEKYGYTPWQISLNLKAFHWSMLWNNLRKRVPDANYKRGTEVVHAEMNEKEKVSLTFKDGPSEEFDLVLFADGYQSLGRQLLFPNVALKYRGYMLWRGLLPESEVEDSSPLGSNVPRISYPNLPGNFVVYLVPNHDGSIKKGERIFNWAAYIPLAEEQLPEFMIDCEGNQLAGSIPPGKMRMEKENELKQLMQDNLPTFYGDIVCKSTNTYVQLIYTTQLPAYHYGRIALIGDAGFFVPPFTGSGVFKGFNNIKDLLNALQSHENLEEALQVWGKEQVRIGNRLLALGEQMEQAFIWNSLDLANADAEKTAAWWKAGVTYPEEFTLEGEEK